MGAGQLPGDPQPQTDRLGAGSALPNRENRIPRLSSGTPWPWSRTWTATMPPGTAAVLTTIGGSPCRTALVTRLIRICCSRAGSARTFTSVSISTDTGSFR
nr:hypothetical protein GCM10020093_109920 [Planobispora longispora]